MKESKRADLVNAFNTIVLELTLFAKQKIDVAKEADLGNLHKSFRDKTKKIRNFYSCLFIDFTFRGIPSRMDRGYVFGGRSDVNFKAFTLNEDELKSFEEELEKQDINDALRLVEQVTSEVLEKISEDIENFIEDKKEKKEIKTKHKTEKKHEKLEIKKDNFEESIVRMLAEKKSAESCSNLYKIYKEAHGMLAW